MSINSPSLRDMSKMLHLGIESMGLGQLFSISAPWDTFVLEINHE